MENFKDVYSIEIYDNPLKLIEEQRPEYKLDEEVRDYLDHINDFEVTSLCVINGEFVLAYDRLNSDVFDRQTMTEFIESIVELAIKETENC